MVDDLTTALTVASESSEPLPDRARTMLGALRRAVPFDAAWLALLDPLESSYSPLACVDLDAPVVRYLEGPTVAHDVEATGADSGADTPRPTRWPADLPVPSGELTTWAQGLLSAGVHEALAVGLFTADGRHVGLLALLFDEERAPAPVERERLAAAVPVLAQAIDPMRSLLTAARLVPGATAAVALREDGRTEPIGGWPGDPLLAEGSVSLAAALVRLRTGQVCSSFLWSASHEGVPTHVRITALATPGDLPRVQGVVAVSPASGLRGLTPRELQVLGFVVEGCSNQEIAHALTVTARTVAAHLEHVLAKLDVPARTLAAVRAEQEGLYVPAPRSTRSPVLARTAPAPSRR